MNRLSGLLLALVFIFVSTVTQAKPVAMIDPGAVDPIVEVSMALENMPVENTSHMTGMAEENRDCPCKTIKMPSFLCGVPMALDNSASISVAFSSSLITFVSVDGSATSAYLRGVRRPPRAKL